MPAAPSHHSGVRLSAKAATAGDEAYEPGYPLKPIHDGQPPISAPRSRELCQWLEQGRVLFLAQTPFDMPEADIEFLRRQRQSGSQFHKNIAYRPAQDKVTGYDRRHIDSERLLQVMRDYSRRVSEYMRGVLAAYHGKWRLDYASFRPLQEQGRKVRLHARNDLLHVDAFPTRPTAGDRILRVFTNINPTEPRRWITSEPFHKLVEQLVGPLGVPLPAGDCTEWRLMWRAIKRVGKSLHLPFPVRTAYDEFMVQAYRRMKESRVYQETCPKFESSFPPGSTWMVYTDSVPHAALRGQYALEQTFLVSREAMLCPDKCPINILERLCGGRCLRQVA
jgi:hypothetical protein